MFFSKAEKKENRPFPDLTKFLVNNPYYEKQHLMSQSSYRIHAHLHMISMSDYISINLPPVLRNEADLYVQGGYFTDRSEFIRAAIREYIEKLSSKRVAIAIQLYKERRLSLGGAAQIANTSIDDMKHILRSRGVEIHLGPEDGADAQVEYETAKGIL